MWWRKKTPRYKVELQVFEIPTKVFPPQGMLHASTVDRSIAERAMNDYMQSLDSKMKKLISVSCEVSANYYINSEGRAVTQIKVTIAYVPK